MKEEIKNLIKSKNITYEMIRSNSKPLVESPDDKMPHEKRMEEGKRIIREKIATY